MNILFIGITVIFALDLSVFSFTDNLAIAQTNQNNTPITCKEGYVILTKQDGTTACVFPSTYLRLIDRGWEMWDRSMMMNQPMMMNNVMNQMIQNPELMQQWHDMMMQNQQEMRAQWIANIKENPQLMANMMGPMTLDPELQQKMIDQMMGSMMGPMMNDPQLRQQMLDMMSQNQDFIQSLKQNPQFLDEIKGDDDKKEDKIGVNSQNAQVSIVLGSASPGCETTNECYIPYSVSIKEHSSMTWTNDDMAVHTATSGIPSEGPNGIFDSGLISPGKTFTNQFDEEGTFDYYCIAHPWMTGKVIVN